MIHNSCSQTFTTKTTWQGKETYNFIIIINDGWPVNITTKPNILLETLSSNTLNQCSSLNERNQFSYPYKATGNITVLYIASIPQIQSAPNFFMNVTELSELFKGCCIVFMLLPPQRVSFLNSVQSMFIIIIYK
jgi:hypothetical protein